MICNSNAFCPTLKMFLFMYISSIYVRKFLVITHSTQVTKVHLSMLLSFQIFLNSRATFSYFLISLPQHWKGCGSWEPLYKCCFILPFGYYIRSVKICHSISYDGPLPILNRITWFRHQFWLVSTAQWRISIEYLVLSWLIIFVSWLCLPRYTVSDGDELQAITC